MSVPDPLFLLLCAIAVDAYVGGMDFLFRRISHPVVIIGRAIDWMDDKLNRPHRGVNDRRLRGLLTVMVLCGGAWAVGWGISWLSTHYPHGWIVELLLLIVLLAQRELFDRVRAVGVALKTESLEAGRREVAHIVGRDPSLLDGHGVSRAAIESCAENFSDGVVAPVFWYLIFGFPGLLVYKTANTMDSMIGHRTPRHEAFGMAAARLDDLLNVPPARLAGLLITIAALFTPKARPWAAFKTMLRDAGKHRSINAGWPEAAMAGALNLALAGPRRYREMTVEDPWINEAGTAKATPEHVGQAVYLYAVACLLNALIVLAALLFIWA
ncbi:adenosylcobinamide-phosphate synthase CbiB [Magnetospira sp. QH-2]|uniref:adenosylcobinamide-phosphate synthase CbiB n=1 Tax=Magnetospira sp. (strain QH-2) TaxID=1288970 RepID=UPI0003E80B6E|nr:adenosylcobinamide-phosphate synthase CbiB [Magnetospira sp. QH-2]CCQ72057.1 Cobalamin biosynthetic protein (anaerobic pathway of cobalamin biosynthesis, cobD) [Magnetospira sp. QH-2]